MNEIYCPNCHSPNRRGANYCAACGRRLSAIVADDSEEAPTVPRGSQSSGSMVDETAISSPARMSLELRVGRKTDVGRVRSSNEDSLLTLDFACGNKSVIRPAGLFVVADGMGGHEGGEIASGMLVRALARQAINEWLPMAFTSQDEETDTAGWLGGAIRKGNEEIFEWAHEAGYEMGTTVVAALVEGDRAMIAHVGDSRAYRVNAAAIERLTVDHSLVESLVAANQLSREDARNHPQANVIYRTIGDNPQVMVDVRPARLAPGDYLMLCSDGLSGLLTDEAMQALVLGAGSPQDACDALVDAANQAGGEDNCTVILIQLKSP